MTRTISLAVRAFLAIALFIGFYVLALGVAGGLLYIPYAGFVYAHRISPKLTILCGVGAFAILKSCIFVRTPPFEAPGPEIHEREHPALFAMIREVADKMGTSMPLHVYLIPDVNAFVADVGGFFGIGSRRVMGIGVGLLSVDNVSELKATIAHEFGHYAGGDTRLGAFVYRTRAAIGHVLEAIGDSALSKPFELYGKLFLRVSHGVSRQQELAADRASIALAGREAHVSGLEREARAGVMLQIFLRNEVSPLLDAGLCPSDLFEGFRRFVSAAEKQGVHEAIGAALAEEKTDPYDTHPALAERVAFAKKQPDPSVPLDDRPARELLSNPSRVEQDAASHLLGRVGGVRAARLVAWDDLPELYYAPKLAEDARRSAERLYPVLGGDRYAGLTRALLAALPARDREELACAVEPELRGAPPAIRRDVATPILRTALGALFGAALVERGGRWTTDVGRPLSVVLGDATVEPMTMAGEALEGAEGRRAILAVLAEAAEPALEASAP